jgi:glycosyltransferase involved in cell wall biosynthesis
MNSRIQWFLNLDNTDKNMKVSVVLPAYNEELLIENTLKTIKEQDYQQEFEIIVCDNNSSDRTAEIAELNGAKVVKESRKGTRFAYDTAMRAASGDLILVTNADTKLPKNWIASIVKEYEDPTVVGVGTNTKFYGCPKWVNAFFAFFSTVSPKRAMWGVSMSARREAFYRVGGLNHGVNLNEDAIFSLLLEKIGKVKFIENVYVEMDGRRFNNGFLNAVKAWFKGYGLNGLLIQFNYIFLGKIKALAADFTDHRSEVFGKGEDFQICTIVEVNNDAENLISFINSYKSQSFDKKHCLVAYINNSTDESKSILGLFNWIKIYSKRRSWSEDLLDILLDTNAVVYSFVPANVQLEEGWLSKIYSSFEKDSEFDLIGGAYVQALDNVFSKSIKMPIQAINLNEFNFAAKRDLLAEALSPEVSNSKELLQQLKKFSKKDKFLTSVPVISFKEDKKSFVKEMWEKFRGNSE